MLIYHNITPDHFFESASQPARHSRWGREQLPALVAGSDLQIGLSQVSCAELLSVGARQVVQLPYYFRGLKCTEPSEKPQAAREPLVLVVGRVVPHKRVLEAVEGFALLRDRLPQAKLVPAASAAIRLTSRKSVSASPSSILARTFV